MTITRKGSSHLITVNQTEFKMTFENTKFLTLLVGLEKTIKVQAALHPSFKNLIAEMNCIVQIKIADNSAGRYLEFTDGKIRSKNGIHPHPDICIFFQTVQWALKLLVPPLDQLDKVNAAKNFQMGIEGADELTVWFLKVLSKMFERRNTFGTDMGKGVRRFTSNTNGGPVFVYVKENKILRITPIEFDDDDPPSWTIEARGKSFSPPRKTTISPHSLSWKSMIYSLTDCSVR